MIMITMIIIVIIIVVVVVIFMTGLNFVLMKKYSAPLKLSAICEIISCPRKLSRWGLYQLMCKATTPPGEGEGKEFLVLFVALAGAVCLIDPRALPAAAGSGRHPACHPRAVRC